MAIAERMFTGCIVTLFLLAVGTEVLAQASDGEQRNTIESPANVGEADRQAQAALGLPIERRSQIAHQQYGVTILDDQDGVGVHMITEFANGRRDQSGLFCAELAIISGDDQLLMRIRQRAGVGASSSWKPLRARVEDKIDMSALRAQHIGAVEIVHYACGSVGQPQIRRGTQALAGDIINDHGGEVPTPPERRTPRERLGLF
ncbi:MAG: hypothetical protein ACR2RA_27080 [Geminicoccaceae bacterium]